MKEREKYETLGDFYSIIKLVEHLEKAFVRECISAEEYAKVCTKLIGQFKTMEPVILEYYPDGGIENTFMKEYKMECPAAKHRLLKVGVPATIEHSVNVGQSSGKNSMKVIAETTEKFINARDALEINFKSVDKLQPLISAILESLGKCQIPDFEGRTKLKEWLMKFNKMKASDDLDDDAVRQLAFDLESSYDSFNKILENH